jgi:hypothetical protein
MVCLKIVRRSVFPERGYEASQTITSHSLQRVRPNRANLGKARYALRLSIRPNVQWS